MIRIALSLFISTQLFAFDIQSASLIFEKIFHAMFLKEHILVYSDSQEYKKVIDNAATLYSVAQMKYADIILLENPNTITQDFNKHPVFTTNAFIFSHLNAAVGAFYWEHGKPKILFLKQRLEDYNISLDPKYNKYIVETLP